MGENSHEEIEKKVERRGIQRELDQNTHYALDSCMNFSNKKKH